MLAMIPYDGVFPAAAVGVFVTAATAPIGVYSLLTGAGVAIWTYLFWWALSMQNSCPREVLSDRRESKAFPEETTEIPDEVK